ncbi:MAG: GTP-binding protein [Comamonadaceae bacterium]|nr:GTP-binding protein [Comamonadaceae bacterium]
MADLDHVIIGTAGHIDHGKSALVRALTGTDPDTLPEEKARGMTIELGFVFLDEPGYPKQIVFIDVPGHEKFVKTMAAGRQQRRRRPVRRRRRRGHRRPDPRALRHPAGSSASSAASSP